MNGYGRPRAMGAERLDCFTGVMLTRRLRDALEQEAEAAGYKTLSAYLRSVKLQPAADQESEAKRE